MIYEICKWYVFMILNVYLMLFILYILYLYVRLHFNFFSGIAAYNCYETFPFSI